MKSDTLKKFAELYDSLLQEKADLEARLAEINAALGSPVASVAPSAAPAKRKPGRPPAAKPARRRGRPPGMKRAVNQAPLKDTVIAILTEKQSLPRKELLDAVIATGYKFTASDPLNSLSTLIYSNRKIFNAKKGVISLV